MTEHDLTPSSCAIEIARIAEDMTPEDWTTDEMADFWHKLTQECVLRLVRLKPEIVSPWPPR